MLLAGCQANSGVSTPLLCTVYTLTLHFPLPHNRSLGRIQSCLVLPSLGVQHTGVGKLFCSRRAGRQRGEADQRFLSPGGLAPPGSRVCSYILDLFAWPRAAPCLPRLPACAPIPVLGGVQAGEGSLSTHEC